MMLLRWHLLVVFTQTNRRRHIKKNSGCKATDMTSNIIITPQFTLITVLLVKKFKDDRNKLTVNWISTILLFESISQLASRTILSKANLLSSLQHLQTRKHRRQRLLLGEILTGRRDLTSHWLRELSVTDLIAACSGGTAKDVQEETTGERREEKRRGY